MFRDRRIIRLAAPPKRPRSRALRHTSPPASSARIFPGRGEISSDVSDHAIPGLQKRRRCLIRCEYLCEVGAAIASATEVPMENAAKFPFHLCALSDVSSRQAGLPIGDALAHAHAADRRRKGARLRTCVGAFAAPTRLQVTRSSAWTSCPSRNRRGRFCLPCSISRWSAEAGEQRHCAGATRAGAGHCR